MQHECKITVLEESSLVCVDEISTKRRAYTPAAIFTQILIALNVTNP